MADKRVPYNPRLSDADVVPEDLCDCGHPASEHGERLPSPCWHGISDDVRHPPAITADIIEKLQGGCRCIGFKPARTPVQEVDRG